MPICFPFPRFVIHIFSLAEAAYDKAAGDDGGDPPTTALSPFFEPIVERLLETTDRTDGTAANLRSAAYEALMEMIKNSAQDNYVTVQKTTKVWSLFSNLWPAG